MFFGEEIHRRQRGAFDSTVAVALLESGFSRVT